MRRLRHLISPLLVVIILLIWPSRFADGAEPVERALKSSVVIEMQGLRGWAPVGSGTLVKSGPLGLSILTAQHVATVPALMRACDIRAEVRTSDTCVFLGEYYTTSRSSDMYDGSDWALFPVWKRPGRTRPATINHKTLSPGREVIVVGNPSGTPWVSHGTVAWMRDAWGEDVYELDTFVWPGSSGGGVFDSRGRLIGVTVALYLSRDYLTGIPRMMEDRGIAVPVGNVRLL